MKFKLGQTVTTQGIAESMETTPGFSDFVLESLFRYMDGDWGDVHPEDQGLNDEALENGDRILAVYKSEKYPTIWIITEWDRSVTTILFPEEY